MFTEQFEKQAKAKAGIFSSMWQGAKNIGSQAVKDVKNIGELKNVGKYKDSKAIEETLAQAKGRGKAAIKQHTDISKKVLGYTPTEKIRSGARGAAIAGTGVLAAGYAGKKAME